MWFAWSLSMAAGVDESVDERFLTGLRSRRLFDLAEKYCQERLADSQLSDGERGALTLEWMRTASEHAANSPLDRRQALWERAEETAATFLRLNPRHSQVLFIKTQQALLVLARGELARLESEVAADPQIALEAARETIRRATKLLESLAAELSTAIPLRRRDKLPPDELTAAELSSLLNNVRFHWARAARNQGLSYPDGSPDRIAALSQAVEQLAVPLRELAPDEPLGMKMRLEAATCQRLLKDNESAGESLQMLDADGVPADMRLAARAELVRGYLGRNRPQEALNVLAMGREMAGHISAELDFAHLETYVSLWQAAADAKQNAESDKWRDRAIQTVKLIEQSHGRYWGRRAEILLVRAGGQRGGGSLEILRRAADNFFLKGQADEALATYDKATVAAHAAGDSPAAFELAFKAALLEQQRQRHADAGRRFRDLSLAVKEHPQAAKAHLLAVVNEAQAWKADPARRDQYLLVLEEHRANWPYATTANAARLWLGGLREREQAWQQAVEAYRAVNRESEQYLEAIQGADRCWSMWLQQRRAAGDDVELVAREAASWFEASVLGPENKLPDPWDAMQRVALLAAARLRLVWTRDQRPEIEQRLQSAISGLPPPTPEWVAECNTLLIVAIAGQSGRTAEARQILTQTPTARTDHWLGMVLQLAALQNASTGESRIELAKLQLAALDRLVETPGKLAAELQIEVARLRGLALSAAGDQRGAIDLFADLARRLPQDGQTQATLGDMLLASEDRADWQRALDQWRIVASKSQPRSARWFKAKYAVALAQFQLGEKNSAAKLIRYLQATENLASSGLEREFLELLRQCQ